MKKKIVFGGGCFWCTEAIFNELNGVVEVKSGYSGGKYKDPTYHEVVHGHTGHAEVIEVTYDENQVGLDDLLIVHMTTHDPTTPNQQGPDRGSQYRSIILYGTDAERVIAEEVLSEVQKAYPEKVVTELVPLEMFYEAEIEHQKFSEVNSDSGYCQIMINPKLSKLRKLHSKYLKVPA